MLTDNTCDTLTITKEGEKMEVINEVFTIQEASDLWGVSDNTLKQKCMGRVKGELSFYKNEFKKSGRAWLVTREGMERLYGKLQKE